MSARWRVTIRGQVQGIGYRWFVRETAEAMDLSGWVRNLPGGAVELEAQGPTEDLERLVERLKTGHPYARVDSVERDELRPVAADERFAIR